MDISVKEGSGEGEDIKRGQKKQEEKKQQDGNKEECGQIYKSKFVNQYERIRNQFAAYQVQNASSQIEKKEEEEFIMGYQLPALRAISKHFVKIRDCDSLKPLHRISAQLQLSIKVVFRMFQHWHRDPTFLSIPLTPTQPKKDIQLFSQLRKATLKIIQTNPMLTIEEIVQLVMKEDKFNEYGCGNRGLCTVSSALRLSGYEYKFVQGEELELNGVVQLRNRGNVSQTIVNYLFEGFALYFIGSMKLNLYSDRKLGWMTENNDSLPKFYDEYANHGEHVTILAMYCSARERLTFDIKQGNYSKEQLREVLKKMMKELQEMEGEEAKEKEKEKEKGKEKEKNERKVLVFPTEKGKELRCDRFIKQHNFTSVFEMPAGCSQLTPVQVFFDQIRQKHKNEKDPIIGQPKNIQDIIAILQKNWKKGKSKEKKEEMTKEKTYYKTFLRNVELAAYGHHF